MIDLNTVRAINRLWAEVARGIREDIFKRFFTKYDGEWGTHYRE